MTNHILYTAKDFEHYTHEEMDTDRLYDLVMDGGLSVCKVCNEFEAGLDNPCIPTLKETNQ